MSTLRVENILNAAGSAPANIPGTARAWVTFSGVNTPSILATFNVGSVTDNGTGDYTLNLSSALADANYTIVGNSLTESASAQPGCVAVYATDRTVGPVTQSTSAVRIRTGFGNATAGYDFARIYVALFR